MPKTSRKSACRPHLSHLPPNSHTHRSGVSGDHSRNANQVDLLNRLGQGVIFDTAWLPDGQTLAAISWTGIYLYDGKTLAELQFIANYGVKHKLTASPDGRYLAVPTANDVQLWDVQTGQVVHTLERA